MSHHNYVQHFKQFKRPEKTTDQDETNNQDETKYTYGIVVKCERLYVRTKPDLDSDPICTIDKDVIIKVLSDYGDFYKILINNKIGYCVKEFIQLKK